LLILDWSSYFIAGIVFSQILKDKLKIQHGIVLVICLLLSFYNLLGRVQEFRDHYEEYYFSTYFVFIAVTMFFLLMLMVSIGKLNFLNSPKLLKIGLLTYPLYLLHQMIGYVIFNSLGHVVNKYALLTSTVVLMIATSYVIIEKIEPPFSAFLRKKLDWIFAKITLKSS